MKNTKVFGSGEFSGANSFDSDVKIFGGAVFSGSLSCRSLKIFGAADVSSDVRCENLLRICGALTAGGRIEAETVKSAGAITCNGDISAETVKIHGGADIKGLLNAENITVIPTARCFISEIGGTKLTVKREPQRIIFDSHVKVNDGSAPELECKSIEADEVDIIITKAETVRGRKVRIGKDCIIGKVEYSESLVVDKNAKVGEKIKI